MNCVTGDYDNLDEEKGEFTVYNSGHFGVIPFRYGVEGSVDFLGLPNGGAYVNFGSRDDFGPDTEPNYNITDTDYENYSIVYNCNRGDELASLWILAREPEVDQDLY